MGFAILNPSYDLRIVDVESCDWVGVRLASPTPRGQYWLFLLLFAAIHQPAVACSAQKPWIWVMSSVPETAAMLAVILYFSADLLFLPDFGLVFGRAGNYHINARKATMRASKLTFAAKRFKFG
jgi:hypothetical protein